MLRLVFVLKAWRRGCRPVGPGVEAVPCGPHFTSCLIPRLVGEIPSGLLIRFRPWKRAGRLHSIEKARADLMPSQASEGSSNTAPWAALDEEESGREFLCRPFSEQVAPPLRHMVPHRSALRKGSGTVVSGFLAVLRRPSRRLGCSPEAIPPNRRKRSGTDCLLSTRSPRRRPPCTSLKTPTRKMRMMTMRPAVGGVGTTFPDARLKTTIGLRRSGQKGEG